MILAKLMQMLQRISDVPFELVFLSMDPGYSKENRLQIEKNAQNLEIPVVFFETPIFDVTTKVGGSPCYLCARMRRGYLYAKARELGCNKIALGHHMSDAIETTLMSMLFSGQIQGMLPRLKSTNFEGMELIRPMYYVLERDIIRWKQKHGLEFLACACKLTEGLAKGDQDSARHKVKQIIADLKKDIPEIEDHILKSISNCQADTMIAYKVDGEKHSFLDRLDNGEKQ